MSARYLKHKHNWWVQTTSTKTRVKGKSNDQNRSQYFTWSTFNQTRTCPKKDQTQILRQSHLKHKLRQRQLQSTQLDIKNENSILKQKWIKQFWKKLWAHNISNTIIMPKIINRGAQLARQWKWRRSTSNCVTHIVTPKVHVSKTGKKIAKKCQIKSHKSINILWIIMQNFMAIGSFMSISQ